MKSILKFFQPKDKIFYQLFDDVGQNLIKISDNLVRVVNETDYNTRASIIKEMEDLEHDNDFKTHQIFIELGKNFITPFDREDIHQLASSLDDIVDYVYATAKKINFYKINPNENGIQKNAEIVNKACLIISDAINNLKDLKNNKKIVDSIIKVKLLEDESDKIYDLNIESLFENNTDFKELIKKREIYKYLETAVDKCEDVVSVMESIIVKYS